MGGLSLSLSRARAFALSLSPSRRLFDAEARIDHSFSSYPILLPQEETWKLPLASGGRVSLTVISPNYDEVAAVQDTHVRIIRIPRHASDTGSTSHLMAGEHLAETHPIVALDWTADGRGIFVSRVDGVVQMWVRDSSNHNTSSGWRRR